MEGRSSTGPVLAEHTDMAQPHLHAASPDQTGLASPHPRTDVVPPLNELLARTVNNRALLVELIEIFEGECADMVAELQRSVNANDAEGVQGAAHRFRGSLRIFGARRAVDIAVELESMGRNRILDRAATRVVELEREVLDVRAVLTSYYRALLAET
jgi:HPt (histidine-containing phosphotransfer) domain-containing protein